MGCRGRCRGRSCVRRQIEVGECGRLSAVVTIQATTDTACARVVAVGGVRVLHVTRWWRWIERRRDAATRADAAVRAAIGIVDAYVRRRR